VPHGKASKYRDNGELICLGDWNNGVLENIVPQDDWILTDNFKRMAYKSYIYLGEVTTEDGTDAEIPDGWGAAYTLDGFKVYEGYFFQGSKEGKGTSYYDNGKKCYDGMWWSDQYEGKGVLYKSDGKKKYQGCIFNNKFEENGILYWDNGNIQYNGFFEDNKRKGNSLLTQYLKKKIRLRHRILRDRHHQIRRRFLA
jgi:hypothetical protein